MSRTGRGTENGLEKTENEGVTPYHPKKTNRLKCRTRHPDRFVLFSMVEATGLEPVSEDISTGKYYVRSLLFKSRSRDSRRRDSPGASRISSRSLTSGVDTGASSQKSTPSSGPASTTIEDVAGFSKRPGPNLYWQLCFSRFFIEAAGPRHALPASSIPVETISPPLNHKGDESPSVAFRIGASIHQVNKNNPKAWCKTHLRCETERKGCQGN